MYVLSLSVQQLLKLMFVAFNKIKYIPKCFKIENKYCLYAFSRFLTIVRLFIKHGPKQTHTAEAILANPPLKSLESHTYM